MMSIDTVRGDPKFQSMTDAQLARFLSKIEVLQNGCWQWRGSVHHGYGRIAFGTGVNQQRSAAHRFSYQHFIGDLPDYTPCDGELDHLCRNRGCVNPTHLELVVHKVNIQRGETGRYLHTRENHAKMAAAKMGKSRPWTPEWRAALNDAHRRLSLAQTHCKRGHLYDTATTYISKHGWRSCRICRNEAANRHYHKKTRKVA